jgi:hypothetical protein
MNERNLVFDKTESQVWGYGYGTFTQAPAAAGVHLFLEIARDAEQGEDVRHFEQLVSRLMDGLNGPLFDDARNTYLGVPSEAGECYQTVLFEDPEVSLRAPEVQGRVGLSCYSLAANFFLQDPDVGLLPADDTRAAQTLELALKHLGDEFDERIVTWHIRRHGAHMGYGQGQLLAALVYGGGVEEFWDRLDALFEVSQQEVGDSYLMQEVLNRSGRPSRGNKAHCTYYPVLVALLAGIVPEGDPRREFIPDVQVR